MLSRRKFDGGYWMVLTCHPGLILGRETSKLHPMSGWECGEFGELIKESGWGILNDWCLIVSCRGSAFDAREVVRTCQCFCAKGWMDSTEEVNYFSMEIPPQAHAKLIIHNDMCSVLEVYGFSSVIEMRRARGKWNIWEMWSWNEIFIIKCTISLRANDAK